MKRPCSLLLVLLIALGLSGLAGATDVIGNINVDTIWSPAGSPYVLTGDVTVQPQAVLTIEPGVVVQASDTDALGSGTDNSRVELVIRGRLIAEGSLAEPIAFQGAVSDPGSWYGILFDTGAGDCSLAHVQVRDAEIGIWSRTTAVLGLSDFSVQECVTGLLWQSSADASIVRGLFHRNTGVAVQLEDDGAAGMSAYMTDSTVRESFSEGIRVTGRVALDLQRSQLYGNQSGMIVDAGGALDAVNNVVVGNWQEGLSLEQSGSAAFRIVNNTIDRNVPDPADPLGPGIGVGLSIQAVTDAAGFVVRNNLITNHGQAGIRVLGGAEPSLDHNDVWGNGANYDGASAGAGSVSVNPLYIAPMGGYGDWVFVPQPVSVRNPGDNYYNSWIFERTGALRMRLVIPYLSTESCCDRLFLYNRAGTNFATYSGSFSGTTDGDYIRAVFDTDSSVFSNGFDIDGYEFQLPDYSTNYRLQSSSPVIDVGNDLDAPADDADGTARPYDGDVDGTATTDMGAYEWHENIPPLAVAGPDRTILPGTQVDFDAGASNDPDGTIVSYEWDFDDGQTGSGVQVSHTFDNLGQYLVLLTVTDDQDAVGTDTVLITVADNLPPVAEAGPDQFAEVGEPVTLDGGNSTDPDGTIVDYAWDFGDASPPGSGRTVTHTWAREGVFTVTLTVTDNRGLTDDDTTAVVIGSGQNQPPVADAGGPYTGRPGEVVQFDGSGSTDPDGTVVDYAWDFGDGNTGSGALPTHTYTEAGAYLVLLVVTDDGGATDGASTLVNISETVNVPPQADAGGPYTGELGQDMAFDGSGSTDSDGTIVDWTWDFGDGATASGEHVIHAYDVGGNYLVRLTVTDDGGATDEDTALVSVETPGNTPPVADAGGDKTAEVGESILFDAGASVDPDGTIVSWSWDFGDGASADGEQVSHAFSASGAYLVRLTVTDDGGAVGQDVALAYVVGVQNQPPRADAGGNQRIDLGSPVLLNGAGSSDPDGTIVSYEWDLGDGNTAAGVAVEHTYQAAGSYLVNLTVTDDNGATDEDFALIEVAEGPANTPPAADAGTDKIAGVGESIMFDGSASADSDGTIVDWVWDFGDGETASGEQVSHAYAAGGNYMVRLTVTDNDGATDEDSVLVTIETPSSGSGCGCASGGDRSPGGILVLALFLGLVVLSRRAWQRA